MAVTVDALTIFKLDSIRCIKLKAEHVFSQILLSVKDLFNIILCRLTLLTQGRPRYDIAHPDNGHTVWKAKIRDHLHCVVIDQILLLIEIAGLACHRGLFEKHRWLQQVLSEVSLGLLSFQCVV